MGSHPINLAMRFILEIAALFVIGLWGWKLSDGWIRFAMALGFPIIIGAIWGFLLFQMILAVQLQHLFPF